MIYTVTNSAAGARCVLGGPLVDAGATADIELTDDEAVLFSELGGVTVTKAKAKAEKADAKE
ncbi:hypothetical protein [Novosphingobium sp.]|uniref:hypothetical protein n=1 Tax=Novosphingobium sp. TaxID=1874826 RepID=UPI00286D8F27|nr:hypothetical protein [Novosphingobium sp.]